MANEGGRGGGFDNQGPMWRRRSLTPGHPSTGTRPERPTVPTSRARQNLLQFAFEITYDKGVRAVADSIETSLTVPADRQAEAQDTIAQINSFAYRVRQTDRLPEAKRAQLQVGIPQVTREIFHDIEFLKPDDIKRIPLLVGLLDTTVAKELKTAPEIEAVMRRALDLQNTDPRLARQILEKLVTRAKDVNVDGDITAETGADLKRFFESTNDRPTPEARTRITEADARRIALQRRDEHKLRDSTVKGIIMGITLSEEAVAKIVARIEKQYEGSKHITEAGKEREIEAAVRMAEERIKGDLLRTYHNIFTGWTPEQRDAALHGFISELGRHGANLSPEDVTRLRTEAKAGVTAINEVVGMDYGDDEEEEEEERERRRRLTPEERIREQALGQVGQLEREGGFSFLNDQREVIVALLGARHDRTILEDFYKEGCGENWEMFYTRIRSVFEHVLAQADTRPNDFFDQGFDQFTSRRVYNTLINILQQSGNSLTGTEIKVSIKDDDFLPSYDQMLRQGEVAIGGKISSPRMKEVDVNFAQAMSDYMPRSMIRLMTVTEYLHNAHAITNLGLGFEQMAKFAERLTTSDLDWIFHTDPKVSEAYQYYMRALNEVTASENYISPSAFGETDQKFGLDAAQRVAYFQMLSELTVEQQENPAITNEIKRKIRMASGIAKGGTFEYWKTLLGSKMMVSWKKDKGKFAVKQLYTSSHDAGMEKMLATIDLDLLYERFALPPEWHQIRDVFQPRDWDGAQSWSEESFTHTDIDRYAKLTGDAQFRGRTDELKEHDERNISMRDMLTTHVLDLFYRGGWRFAQYESGFIHRDKVNAAGVVIGRELDPVKTLDAMREVGLYMTKTFLDETIKSGGDHTNLFRDKRNRPERWRDDTGLDAAYAEFDIAEKLDKEVSRKQKHRSRGSHFGFKGFRIGNMWKEERMTHARFADAKTRLMGKLYELEVFDRVTNIRPSKWLSTERRRVTPLGEKTLFERLNGLLATRYTEADGYPANFVEKKLYPVCVSALGMAESIIWKDRSGTGDLDYTLTEEMIFNDEKVVDRIKSFYLLSRIDVGKVSDVNFENGLSLNNISEGQFVDLLKDFFRELKAGIADPSRLSHQPGRERTAAQQAKVTSETLGARYGKLLHLRQGDIDKVLGGDDFDHTKHFHRGVGGRVPARLGGDAHKIADKMIPNCGKLLMHAIPGFAHHGYRDSDKEGIKEGVEKLLVPPIAEAAEVITQLSAHEGHEFSARMLAFMPRIFGADSIYRMPLLGPVLQGFMGRLNHDEPNFVSDFFRNIRGFRTTVLESDGVNALIRAGIDGLHIARTEFTIHGFEEPDLTKHPVAEAIHDKFSNTPLVGKAIKSVTENIMKRRRLAAVINENALRVPVFGEAIKAVSGIFIRPTAHFERHKWNFEAIRRISGPDTASEIVGQYWLMYLAAAGAMFIAAGILAHQMNKKSKEGQH